MAKVNFNLPRIDVDSLSDSQAIRKIMSYLYTLNEQLRYELTHIDEDNISGEGLGESAFSAAALKKAIQEQMGSQKVDLSDNETILTIQRRLESLNALEKEDAGNISSLQKSLQAKVDKVTVEALEKRVSGNESSIQTLTAELATKAAKTTVDALTQRVSTNEGNIQTLTTELGKKAAQTTVDALAQRVSTNEGSISTVKQTADSVSLEVRNARAGEATLGARFAVVVNQIVSEVKDRTDADSALAQRVSTNEGSIQTLTTELGKKATQTTVSALSDRLTTDEGAITQLQTSVTGLGTRLSQAEIDIDGAEAAIALKASQATVDAMGTRLSQAEIDIDGANAAIKLKASQADLSALGTRVTQAEIDIDGAEAAIALKASQATVDAMGTRLSQAEIDIDGAEAAIALKVSEGEVVTQLIVETNNVTIDNGNLRVSGYITASQLNSTLSEARYVYATSLDVSGTLWYKDRSAGWMSQKVVTGLSTATATFLDTNGAMKTIRYLTATPSTTTIYYLGESGAA